MSFLHRCWIAIITQVDLISFIFTGEKTGILQAGVGGASAPIKPIPAYLPGRRSNEDSEESTVWLKFLEDLARTNPAFFARLFYQVARDWTPLPTRVLRKPSPEELLSNTRHLEGFLEALATTPFSPTGSDDFS